LKSLIWIFCLLIVACAPEQETRIVENYKDGGVAVIEEIEISEGDTSVIFIRKFHKNGELYMEGPLKDNAREGTWKTYYENGKPWSITNFQNDQPHGSTKTWYPNGQVRFTGQYSHGEKTGIWFWYDEKGDLIRKIDLEKGTYTK
jgi:antitoxin component YwqK of YwqJK toxin-antitoxin module